MERRRGITVHWGLLLIVYLAILFATAMVSLTSQSGNGYFVLLLAAGVPIYVIASGAIMGGQKSALTGAPLTDAVEATPQPVDAKILPFPERRLPADHAAIEIHPIHRSKLG